MSRYDKYFLRHLLWLEDSFCHYYVQNDFWGRPEILDVEYVIFNWEEDAEYWIAECAEWEPYDTISRLRIFLAADCLTQYQVHRMNDRQVVRTAARELCMNAHRMVINPKIGWAVQVDAQSREPVQPIAVESAPDLDGLLDELKIHLDAMVADRQRQTEQLNAKLAEMNAFEKSWELQKRTFKSAPQYLPLRNAVDALRALPDTVKTMGKLLATGGNILEAVTDAVRAGSMEPIQSEIKQAVAPLVETAEQARQATAMVQVLLNDKETYALLYDFGERYLKAMHPLDIAEYGLKAASVIITLIASIAAMIYTGGTSGANTAGKLLISIKRLRDASPVVDKIYKALKCVAYRFKLPKLKEKVAKVKRKVTKNKGKGDVPEVKPPDKIDKNGKKSYSGNDDGPKKVYGSAANPRVEWRKNKGGVTRTKEEAIEIAEKAKIDTHMMDIHVVDDLPDNIHASYTGLQGPPDKLYKWDDIVHDITEKVPVRVNKNILDSDEAIIATLKHEAYELEALKDVMQSKGMITQKELAKLIDSNYGGELHKEAWDVADELILKLRGE